MSDTRDRLEALARRADRRARRRLGHDAPERRARARGLPRRALRRPPARRHRRPRPAQPDPARRRPRRPPAVPGRGRRHHDDEHVHRDLDRPGRLRARERRARDERRRRAAGPAGGGRGRRPLRRRLARAAERHAVAVAEGRRPGLPGGDVRPGRRVVRRADPRPARGRRRPAADRDDLRHAEREGGDRRRPRRRAGAAALDLGHDRRPLRPDAVRPDRRGVLELGRARQAADRRRELLARRGGDAPARRRAGPARRHVHELPPERGPAERVRRLRRAAARDGRAARRVRARGPRQHRRRLLRHDAGAHARDRRGGRGICRRARSRNGPPGRGSAAWSRSRSARTPAS